MADYDNSGTVVRVLGSLNEKARYSAVDIEGAFRSQILETHDAPIHTAIIEESHGQFLAHLAHAETYTSETIRFDMDGSDISNVERNYDMGDRSSEGVAKESDDYASYDFFVATPVPNIPTALQMVNNIYNYAKANGYNPVKLTGGAANIANYKKYFQAGLKGFASVGHGSKTGIMLYDGTLSYSWFNGLGSSALSPEVITLNSCQVFNDPFKSSILNHGARTFIGGITNLRIGPSENVTAGFWNTELYTPSAKMGDTLKAESAKEPNAGTFGIGGDTGKFA